MTDPAQSHQTDFSQNSQVLAGPPVGVGVGGKEIEPPAQSLGETPALKEVGHEVPLTAEVSGAGVKIHPTTIQLPQKVSQMGVKVVGQAPAPPVITVKLPLSDEQIAQGLHQSIMSSWRWMAEWCIRRLKQVHLGFKSIHGKIMRVAQ